MFTYSSKGLALTKGYEGFSATAYRDVAGVLTIGYGHTGLDVHPGMVITEIEGEDLLIKDMAHATAFVNAVTMDAHIPLNQHQFDALTDFAFNVGVGALKGSHLLIYTNQGKFIEAAAQFSRWVHAAGGVVEPGLVRRRNDEATLFLTPVSAIG